ncbi:hypothetical protein C8Q80DRAFT_818047 [Daedaleopsis nitida]|nr:hypothetical protein C8Q80DRAFT_818047 [Daedaleopsis nitida]
MNSCRSLAITFAIVASMALVIWCTTSTKVSHVAHTTSRMTIIHRDVSPVWDIGPLGDVALPFESSVHYQLNSTQADAEWRALVPSNGGIVIEGEGSDRAAYMLSMFHQLRCLNILRQTYANHEPPNGLTAHCINYIRQMVLCHRDLRLEPLVRAGGSHTVQPWRTVRCQNWRRVYDAHNFNMRTGL